VTQRDPPAIEAKYSLRVSVLDKLAQNIQTEVATLLAGLGNVDRIYFRTKTVASFVDKATARTEAGEWKYQHPFEEIEDQVAGRILVFYRADVEMVLNTLKGKLRQAEQVHHRPSSAKEFDYETTHLVCLITSDLKPRGWSKISEPPETFELQIRTLAQHAWSEPQHAFYKRGSGLPDESLRKLYWAAASAWGMDSIWEELRQDLEQLHQRH